MTYPNPTMAYDSAVYPGSRWKGQVPQGRSGCPVDVSKFVWVPGPAPAQDTAMADQNRRIALYEVMFPHMNRLR